VGLAFAEFTKVENVFSLFPRLPFDEFSFAPQLYVQLPLIPLVATTLVIAGGAPFVRRPRLLALTAAVAGGFLVVLSWMTDTFGRLSWWDRLPQELQVIQFPYRLSSYVLMCLAGLMLVACSYAARVRARRSRAGDALLSLLVVATAAQVGFGLHQIWTAGTVGPVAGALADLDHLPSGWYDSNYFNNSVVKLDPVQPERPWIKTIRPNVDVDSVLLSYPRKLADSEVKTNVVPSPLIEFVPEESLVGQFQDYAVLRVPRSRDGSRVLVRAAHTTATTIGTLITLVSLAGVAGLLGCLAWRGSRPRVPFP